MTGKTPFKTSPIKVIAAANLLPERNTLVAPGLPLPTFLGSSKLNNLETSTALEIEPNRYPKIGHANDGSSNIVIFGTYKSPFFKKRNCTVLE